MKTDFLKSLGIEDEKIIEAIHAENGRDITKVRKQLEDVESERDSLKTQLDERDAQLKELKKSVKDNDDLVAKLEKLENENKTAKETYAAELESLKKNNAIELALKDDKVRSVKALKPFLDMDAIKFENDTLVGYKEQIEKLRSDESTAFLFDASEPHAPQNISGAKPAAPTPPTNPVPQGATLHDAIAKALGSKK